MRAILVLYATYLVLCPGTSRGQDDECRFYQEGDGIRYEETSLVCLVPRPEGQGFNISMYLHGDLISMAYFDKRGSDIIPCPDEYHCSISFGNFEGVMAEVKMNTTLNEDGQWQCSMNLCKEDQYLDFVVRGKLGVHCDKQQ